MKPSRREIGCVLVIGIVGTAMYLAGYAQHEILFILAGVGIAYYEVIKEPKPEAT